MFRSEVSKRVSFGTREEANKIKPFSVSYVCPKMHNDLVVPASPQFLDAAS